jgi:hypothetical protein
MRAILTKLDVTNAKNFSGEKELVNSLNVVGLKKGEMKQIITVRWYRGRSKSASAVYCSIWAHGDGVHISGHGAASGQGYHKESAAFQEALESAGISLYIDETDQYGKDAKDNKGKRCFVDGYGDAAIERACAALAHALDYRKILIVTN